MTGRRSFHNVPQLNFFGKLNVFKLPEMEKEREAREVVDKGRDVQTDGQAYLW